MKAFFKTLFGDWLNLGFVAAIVAVEFGLAHTGHAVDAGIVVPLVIMGGVGWLAMQ